MNNTHPLPPQSPIVPIVLGTICAGMAAACAVLTEHSLTPPSNNLALALGGMTMTALTANAAAGAFAGALQLGLEQGHDAWVAMAGHRAATWLGTTKVGKTAHFVLGALLHSPLFIAGHSIVSDGLTPLNAAVAMGAAVGSVAVRGILGKIALTAQQEATEEAKPNSPTRRGMRV